jgi:hypothetical protein
MVLHELMRALSDEIQDAELVGIGAGGEISVLDLNSQLPVEAIGSAWDTLWFEQWRLPKMLKQNGADLLLVPYDYAPLGSLLPTVVLPVLAQIGLQRGLAERLLRATRMAGAQGAFRRLSFSDLDLFSKGGANLRSIDPWVHSTFSALSSADDREIAARYALPFSYVLAHGISLVDIKPILASWTWVDGSVGDTIPLAVIVSEGLERRTWEKEVDRMGLTHSVRLLNGVKFSELPALYRLAEALLQAGVAVEHQILRWAMACGLPVTGFEVPTSASVLGSAGYLVAPGDSRALGAACLTLVVEPEVRDRLRKASLLRARHFHVNRTPADSIQDIMNKLSA